MTDPYFYSLEKSSVVGLVKQIAEVEEALDRLMDDKRDELNEVERKYDNRLEYLTIRLYELKKGLDVMFERVEEGGRCAQPSESPIQQSQGKEPRPYVGVADNDDL